MLQALLGFTVTRVIPDKVLFGVLTGAYQVCGGVVRNNTGQIVAHLVNGTSPLALAQPVTAALQAVNSYQLHRIGRDVGQLGAGLATVSGAVDGVARDVAGLKSAVAGVAADVGEVKASVAVVAHQVDSLRDATAQLIALSTGTMALAGLTLAASAAGFAFLNKKLGRIDQRLQEMQKDVREIKSFLSARQRAELTTALNTLRDVSGAPSEETRRALLVASRQTLGVLHQHYKSQFLESDDEGMFWAAEEYFAVSAIAHSLCAGELDMFDTAARDMEDAYGCWADRCRSMARERLLRTDPERFLARRYAGAARADELIDWMDFAHSADRGMAWIDDLRARPSRDSWWGRSPRPAELIEIDLLRRLVSRDRVLQGYCAQYRHYCQNRTRPSQYQKVIEGLDPAHAVGNCFVLVGEPSSYAS